jgi:hypothetical protein
MRSSVLLFASFFLYGCQTSSSPTASSGAEANAAHFTHATLHECSVAAAGFKQPTWGVREVSWYRSCMARRGHRE